MIRQGQDRLMQYLRDFSAFQPFKNSLRSPRWNGMAPVSVGMSRSAIPIRRDAIARFLDEWNISGFFFVQFPDVIARNAVEKCRWRSLFFVEFSGISNQRQERFLHNIGCGFRASRHVDGIPIQPALMTAVEFQECVLIPCGEAPHKVNIPRFSQVCHLHQVGRAPCVYSINYFLADAKFHFIGSLCWLWRVLLEI